MGPAKHQDSHSHAYVHPCISGKNLSEVDGFDMKADSDSDWERLWFGTEGNPKPTRKGRVKIEGDEVESSIKILWPWCVITESSSRRMASSGWAAKVETQKISRQT